MDRSWMAVVAANSERLGLNIAPYLNGLTFWKDPLCRGHRPTRYWIGLDTPDEDPDAACFIVWGLAWLKEEERRIVKEVATTDARWSKNVELCYQRERFADILGQDWRKLSLDAVGNALAAVLAQAPAGEEG